ncbi:hypothetical protein [Pedobacter nutrimenti]|uniref:Uncharacterized protein n=1 Tax=Pedobacter nutrimenti TaxID=1241337 RepID=A0A318UKX1_9SPHI|nr:hypothetical protein [Pedobacter nutrimenti]PYF75758.1 hypothetical protein B0O44_102312 [Pedobacter nutrimenti]
MKNYIYTAMVLVAMAFAACNPMKDTLNNLTPDPVPARTLTISSSSSYETTDAANTGISAMLNKMYPQLPNGTKANVTYSYKSNTVKPADSTFANVQYTVTASDYTDGASAVGNGNNKNYSAAQVLAFLEYKYPQAITAANKLVLLTYAFFQSGVTPSSGTLVTEAFLLQSAGWQKIYLLSPAQYTVLGRGINNAFVSADVSSLASSLNVTLKADPAVMLTVKLGDVKYVTYKYYVSATVSHQKIYVLTYDGTNWSPSTTLAFLKQGGIWIPDPTIYYTMVSSDYTNLNLPSVTYNFGTTTNRANVAQYKSFNISATNGTQWTTAEIQAALVYTLNLRFPNAVANPQVPYIITYYAYSGKYTYVPLKFFKTATGFVLADPQ